MARKCNSMRLLKVTLYLVLGRYPLCRSGKTQARNLRRICIAIAGIYTIITHWRLGHSVSNEIVRFWSPPASFLGAIQKKLLTGDKKRTTRNWPVTRNVRFVLRIRNCTMLDHIYRLRDKMAILNAAFYLNRSREPVYGRQNLNTVTPTNTYTTIFHTSVLLGVVVEVQTLQSN